ncbi:MAG: DUF2064 domain-containing protein, partial [Hyphomonadaceae bacterium]|nr:DUF2064 domain-containing protein [Hyphomonadaceae bacterium]
MIRPTLVIFARAPIIGKAKTRLAADIGIVHAKRLYCAMTSRIIRNVSDPRWNVVLAVTPARYIGQVRGWDGQMQTGQVRGSLSARLAHMFASRKGPMGVIGTDAPQVRASDIARGFRFLRSNAAVFGPADDGGFWFMAMRAPVKPCVFDNVRWSSGHTLKDIQANIRGSVARLRTLVDVDDGPALRRVRQK